jgi:NADPH2:quinone reductase
MRAAVVHAPGELPRPDEVPEPARERGGALVAVSAVALNPVEIRAAAGSMPRDLQTPYVPGAEGTGTVLEADGMAAGTRVRFEPAALPGFGSDGVLSEVAVVEPDSLAELPDGVDDAVAAALGVVGITAWLALERAAPVEGATVLVLGATGGVGQMVVQLARLRGAAAVIAAGRSPEGLERARRLGADRAVALDELDAALDGDVDVIVDPLWGEPALTAMRHLAGGGRLVNVGQSAGPGGPLPLEALRSRNAALHLLSSGWTDLALKREAFRGLLGHVAAGELEVEHETVRLEDVADAWRRQAESPGVKLVIRL